MTPLSFLADRPQCPVVLDASVIINLNATECPTDILRLLPHPALITDVVVGELERGLVTGRRDVAVVRELTADGLLTVVSLGAGGLGTFEELVVGPAVDTLDDGEAATIACAIERDAIAALDERKANRICVERFTALPRMSTCDLLGHGSLTDALSPDAHASAVFNALVNARMRVPSHHLKSVVALIGPERAARCTSLGNWQHRVCREVP